MAFGSEGQRSKRRKFSSITEETLASPPPLSSDYVQPLPTLPFDLIPEILCRLPVKLLLQLRCTCKSWNSLISDTKFAKKHLSLSTRRSLHSVRYSHSLCKYILKSYPLDSVFSTISPNVMKLKYPPNGFFDIDCNPDVDYYIVGSCNGMLCLAHFNDDCFCLLWNPSIRKFKELPPFEKPQVRCHINMTHGFGYDHVNNNYKVVVVLHYPIGGRDYKTEVKVHTLGTDFWKSAQEFPFGGVPVELSGKFVSGTINFLASKHPDRNSHCFIVSFNLENESYQKILQPDYGEVDAHRLTLAVLRDCLCMISGNDVWLMKEYGKKESWTKLFTVSYKSHSLTKAIYMFEDDQVLLQTLGNWKRKLIVYDPRNDTYKCINNKSIYNPKYNALRNDLKVCTESLISPWS